LQEPWWVKILYVLVGGFIGYGGYLVRSIHKDKKIRQSILAEVKANVEYGKKRDPFWITIVYENNLDHISAFRLEQLKRIIRFYATIQQHRESEDRGLKEQERLKKEGLWSVQIQSQTDLAREIRQIGEEILTA